MNFGRLIIAALVAPLLAPYAALGADPTAAPIVPSTSDDRIALSADGSTLTGTNGGGGGSVGWLHSFDADTLAGVAIEHQTLFTSNWTFGSVNGSMTRGTGDARYSVYGEAHEGAGDDGPRAFHYSIEALGVVGTYYHRLSAQLEDRDIDVETIHGNLPKVGLSYLWGPRLLTSVTYSYSVNGNLGTRLTAARIDIYGATVNFLAGVAFGQASPVILGAVSNEIVALVPEHRLREGYVGITKPLPHLRSDLALVADYQDLSGIKRATLTLNYIFHVGHNGKP
jgi:hypothetical protein